MKQGWIGLRNSCFLRSASPMNRFSNFLFSQGQRYWADLLLNGCLLLWFMAGPALGVPAQDTAPTGFDQWTAKSLTPHLAEMEKEAPTDPHHSAVRQLADYPNDGFLLVHREGDGQVEWHETQADVFPVQCGTATLPLGGRLVNGETVGPHEKRNGSIIGAYGAKSQPGTSFASRHESHIKFCSMAERSSTIS